MSTSTIKLGLCQCGCGETVPGRFVKGHNRRVIEKVPLGERFWQKVFVQSPDECWEWQGARQLAGYGRFTLEDGRLGLAHRASYELHYGPIPEGMFVCHTCDNPACVNPAHLWLGTHQDNMDDRTAKHRHRSGDTHPRSKLTADDVENIRANRMNLTGQEMAALYGVANTTISAVLNRQNWKESK